MTILTGRGSFSENFLKKYDAEIVSIRELPEKDFVDKLATSPVILHNASTLASESLDLCLKNNFDFTRFLIQNLELVNSSAHLINLSSMSILNSEDSRIYGDPINMSTYAYSKYLTETYCLKSSLKNISNVRFSTIFYEDPKKDGLSKLVFDAVIKGTVTIYNNGDDTRDFIPLDIAVDYVNKIINKNQTGKNIYTIASNKKISFKEVVDVLIVFIPNLKVVNIKTEVIHPVLSQFHTDDVDSLGRIDFDIKDHIMRYARRLQK